MSAEEKRDVFFSDNTEGIHQCYSSRYFAFRATLDALAIMPYLNTQWPLFPGREIK